MKIHSKPFRYFFLFRCLNSTADNVHFLRKTLEILATHRTFVTFLLAKQTNMEGKCNYWEFMKERVVIKKHTNKTLYKNIKFNTNINLFTYKSEKLPWEKKNRNIFFLRQNGSSKNNNRREGKKRKKTWCRMWCECHEKIFFQRKINKLNIAWGRVKPNLWG